MYLALYLKDALSCKALFSCSYHDKRLIPDTKVHFPMSDNEKRLIPARRFMQPSVRG